MLAACVVWRASVAPGLRPVHRRGVGGPPPALVIAPASVQLGSVPPGSRHEVRLGWARRGPGAVRVLGTGTGCGCLGLTGLPASLPEGAAGVLALTLAAPSRPGPVRSSVHVVLDLPPPDDVLRVPLEAYVGEQLVAAPPVLDLGRSRPGRRVQARLSVHLPPAARGAPLAVRLVGLAGAARARPSPLGGDAAEVHLDLLLPEAPGPVEGALALEAPGAGACLVPVTARVEPGGAAGGAPSTGP